ncbi:MAG: AAC(3) family N-acetyltransferase [Lentisphaeria bacterium]|jgi:aminoglycoside 3-N-acetyltransferase
MSQTIHSYASLTRDLERSGIRRQDTLLVHSSMKAIGRVEGRADTVLDVLSDYLRDEGLLVFPTLTWSNVNAEQPVFSVRDTPSVVGILPELFRQRPGVHRSRHPTHSVAALGRDAEAFVEGHERFDSPAALGSPWERLRQRRAKIMFIGAGIASNTFLHGVEEWGQAAHILSDTLQQLIVIDEAGRRHSVPSRRHIGNHSRYYACLEPHFEAIGALSRVRFGDANTTILDAEPCAVFVLDLLKRFPAAFTLEWNQAHPTFFADVLPGVN